MVIECLYNDGQIENIMSYQFEEKTEAERGFSALWDRYLAPDMAAYERLYYRRRLLAYAIMTPTVILFFGISYYLLEVRPPVEQDLYFKLTFVALLGAATAICYFAYLPFQKLKNATAAQLHTALAAHFKDEFVPYEDEEELEDVAGFLKDEKLTSPGSISIGASFICASDQPHYRFFNCSYTTGSDRNRSVTHYLVIHLKLDVVVPEKIRILPDRGFANSLVRILHRRKNVRFSHQAFEKRFEVYSRDETMARTLLTEPVQQAFIDMQDYFSNGKPWWQGRCKVTSLFDQDEMVVCLEGLGDIAAHQLAGQSPDKITEAAHIAINRLSQIPFVVNNLRDVIPQIKRQS